MRRPVSFLSVFAFPLIAGAASAAVEIIDDRGIAVRLDRPAQRLIALAPHLTELAFAAGAGDRLVGATRGSDYPPGAKSIPEVGDASGIDFERLLALRPDLVLAWHGGNRQADVDRLRKLGLNVVALEPRRLDDIPRHLQILGELMAIREPARAAANAFAVRVVALRQRYQHRRPVRVLFEAWHRPLITVNGAHVISDVLALCGAQNVFTDLPRLADAVSPEQVLALDPDAIVVGSEAEDAGLKGWRDYPYLRAVRHGHVFAVPPDLITRQTPRILDAAEKICADLDTVRNRDPTSPHPTHPSPPIGRRR
jgi:iron complex transport system substrate-binding protein